MLYHIHITHLKPSLYPGRWKQLEETFVSVKQADISWYEVTLMAIFSRRLQDNFLLHLCQNMIFS